MSSYNQDYDFQWGQLGASTAANLGVAAPQLADTRRYNKLMIVISGLAAETISVTASPDAGAASTNKLRPIDLSTGAVTASSDLGNGTYLFSNLEGAYSITFTKSSTADNATVRYSIARYT